MPTSGSRADYEQWYGETHTAPELLDRFAFGLPELYRAEIGAARHVAAPGCYPTSAALALARSCTTGSWSPRASWSTPRPACRARGGA